MSREVSSNRKTLFYLGSFLIVVGLLTFVSSFFVVAGAMRGSGFPGPGDLMTRSLAGIALIVVGQTVRRVGARGAAGSGMILDPEQARRDLEPFSRQAGGMLGDALDEADLDLGRSRGPAAPQIMIRCRECETLNEEGSKFCQECGVPL